jgi:protein-tyrosine phosphatase
MTLKQLIDTNHGTWRGWVRHLLAQGEYLAGRLDAYLQPQPARVERLVFVCLGNINRSAFAAEVARSLGAHAVSIGLSTTTGAPAYPMAVSTAREMAVDLGAHTATNLADYQRRPGDLLLVMEVRHVHRLIAHGVPPEAIALLGHWSHPRRIHLHDPYQLSPAYFRSCFVLLQSAVTQLVHELRAAGSPSAPR